MARLAEIGDEVARTNGATYRMMSGLCVINSPDADGRQVRVNEIYGVDGVFVELCREGEMVSSAFLVGMSDATVAGIIVSILR